MFGSGSQPAGKPRSGRRRSGRRRSGKPRSGRPDARSAVRAPSLPLPIPPSPLPAIPRTGPLFLPASEVSVPFHSAKQLSESEKDRFRAHRKAMAQCKTFEELAEWLAVSLEMQDLCWPLYPEAELQSLGSDSSGGTDGSAMAHVIRTTGMISYESQEGLVEYGRVHPNYVKFVTTRNPEVLPALASALNVPEEHVPFVAIDSRTHQRAMIELYGPVKAMLNVVKRLVGLWERAIMGSVCMADGARYLVDSDGNLVPSLSGELPPRTWDDFYSAADGRLLVLSAETQRLEKVEKANAFIMNTRGLRCMPPSEFLRAMHPHEYKDGIVCGQPSDELLAHLERRQNDMCSIVLADICPGAIMPGGLCVWALRHMHAQ